MMSFLLDAHASHGGISAFLSEHLGRFGEFLDEVVLHALLDTLKIIPFLFLTYLLLEFIEHRAEAQVARLVSKAGPLGPLVGGALGVVPQCGFSTVAANLYTGGVIGLGTLLAVFLSTSDEMLIVMLSGNVKIGSILLILVYKAAVGVLVGFAVNILLRLMGRGERKVNVDEMCNGVCHCEDGIVKSALKHTVSVTIYILSITLGLNALLFLVGEEAIATLLPSIPVLSHLISAVVGLIPNCAVSVALTQLAVSGVISEGVMLSGLLSGAGVGLLVLFKMNKRVRDNLVITLILVLSGVLFGLIADALPFLNIA